MHRYVDANVLLRYLLGDIPEQAERARQAINDGVWLCEAVLAEVVYVLEGVYAMPRHVLASLLSRLLNEVSCDNRQILERSLTLYGAKKRLDFVDCLLAAHNQVGNDLVFTFDKDLLKVLVTK